ALGEIRIGRVDFNRAEPAMGTQGSRHGNRGVTSQSSHLDDFSGFAELQQNLDEAGLLPGNRDSWDAGGRSFLVELAKKVILRDGVGPQVTEVLCGNGAAIVSHERLPHLLDHWPVRVPR